MIKVGDKVRRNPDYKGFRDHTKRKKWENYYTEIGRVVKIATDFKGKESPVVQFPSMRAVYVEWEHSLIRLNQPQPTTLKEMGFDDEDFKI